MSANPTIEGLLLGVAANGITAILSPVVRQGINLITGEALRERMKVKERSLESILRKATKGVAEVVDIDEPMRMEEVSLFLTSPEVEAMVRQIYSVKILKAPDDLEAIQREFLFSLSFYLDIEERLLVEPARRLFEALMEGCEHALDVAIGEGKIAALDAKAAFRHRLLIDELAAIQKNLAFLTTHQLPSLIEVKKFEKEFRAQIVERHGRITPPHFSGARRLPIDDIYVAPDFIITPPKQAREVITSISLPDLLSRTYRTVLLGNPGGGKSTFTDKLCYDLAFHYQNRPFANRQVIPIPVVLREYGAEKKQRKCSILQFIESTINSRYQIPPPSGTIEYLLLNGRAVVVFDGLDELLETNYRQEISRDVESFCNRYPSVPVVVTSRLVGYEQAPLDEEKFEVCRLSPFNDDQVQQYVSKWFAADSELTTEQRSRMTQTFLQESRVVPDLRSNPLMLALMCNIYRGENYIPQNRPDVYEKCAVMLFEKWDKSRGIHAPLPFEAHIRPAMMYLAHWIYTDDTLQAGVTESSLISKTADYLMERHVEDRDEAEKAARDFIEFCRGRAWVFTQMGSTKSGEGLYQFTHRTFLEYFTAFHLIRTHPTPSSLLELLLPKIANQEWDVVAQLAFQLQNKNVESAADDLLTGLVDQSSQSKDRDKWNLLSFAARCLQFLVPSAKVRRNITSACFEYCLSWGRQRLEKENATAVEVRRGKTSQPRDMLGPLFDASVDNRATIADSAEKFLVERINNGNEAEILLSLQVGLNLRVCLNYSQLKIATELWDFWGNVTERIVASCSERIMELSPKHYWVAIRAQLHNRVTASSLIKWHGMQSLFQSHKLLMFPTVNWISIVQESLITISRAGPVLDPDDALHRLFRLLRQLGPIVPSISKPWITVFALQLEEHLEQFTLDEAEDQNIAPRLPDNIDNDVLFATFALLSAIYEYNVVTYEHALEQGIDREGGDVEKLQSSNNPLIGLLRGILLARFEAIDSYQVQETMDRCGFTAEQQDFAQQWIEHQFDLVELVDDDSD